MYLDYAGMVRPEAVLATRTEETYAHSEDFFFRFVAGFACFGFALVQGLVRIGFGLVQVFV